MGDMDLIRPIGLAGIRCAVVAPPRGVTTHSRFARTVIPWDDEEISRESDVLLGQLLKFGRSQPEPPVLFYEQDAQLLFVSRNRDRLSDVFRFVIADAELVEDLVDKIRFQDLAERLDLPVPPTKRVRPAADPIPETLGLRFPVVVKPPWRRKTWDAFGEAAKVIQVNTPQALAEAWPYWAQQGSDLIIQELIPGPETRIESYHVYVDTRGDIAGEFTGRKIRTYPVSNGHSTALTITDAQDVAGLGRSLTRKLGLRGIAKYDFKRDDNGRLHLLEVNPRFNLWHHLGAKAGINLPALVYADVTGQPRPAIGPVRTGVRWCRFSEDWHSARESGISLRAWLPWALRCEATTLTWDDPMPFIHTLWRAARDQVGARRAGARQADSHVPGDPVPT